MTYNFFATLSRMKYIDRWALMRNARTETLSEHALDVAMIAHALCVIGNVRFGRSLNADRAALIGLYHDASEIITGDMPTPVKYFNRDIRDAYKEVEHVAEMRLMRQLPEDMRAVYAEIFGEAQAEEEHYMRRLVKAADKISALIKCMEETGAGNGEFRTAQKSTQKAVDELAWELPEVKVFVEEFLPPYGSTLDELLGRGYSMKILVVSDSHGRHDLLRKAIGQEAPIDMLIHAGDVEGNLDKILGPKREYEIHAVAGNMDWGDSMPPSDQFEIGGHKVFLTHGHGYGVSYTLANLRQAAEERGADVAIYGHTHMPAMDEQNDILLLNPGSVAKPRQAGLKKTYAVIMLDEKTGRISVSFKSLRGIGWN